MALRKPVSRPRPEPTIALINIVFLMLIFFMIAGSLAPPPDPEVRLIDVAGLDGRPPPDAAVLRSSGELMYRGAPVTAAEVVAAAVASPDTAGPETAESPADAPGVRLVPDRDVPAPVLMRQVAALRRAGAGDVWIVTERGLQ